MTPVYNVHVYMKILSICSEVIQVDKKEDRDRIFPNLLVPSHKTWIRFDESKISLYLFICFYHREKEISTEF